MGSTLVGGPQTSSISLISAAHLFDQRVAAAYNLFTNMSNQMGIFEAGLVASWLGPVAAVVAGGTIAAATAGTWAILFPGLRRIDRL